MRFFLLLSSGIVFCLTTAFGGGLRLEPKENGVLVDGGAQLRFEVEYPVLSGTGSNETIPIVEKRVQGNTAVIRYAGGARADLRVEPDRTVSIRFSDCGDRVKSFSFSTLISFYFRNGGRWKFDEEPLRAFPAARPPEPFLFSKHAGTFAVYGGNGRGVAFTLPPYAFNQLVDNRAWDWKMFAWKCFVPFNRDHPEAVLRIAGMDDPAIKAANPVVLIDALGQSTLADWPDKMRSVDELKADAAAEGAYYASFRPPAFDRFGGLPGSRAALGLQASGFFHVEEKKGRWFLVDPEGNAFYHLGVCCFAPPNATWVAGRRETFAWLPEPTGTFETAFLPKEPDSFSFHAANLIRKYGEPIDPDRWAARMIGRVRAWGFNSAGAFSDPPPGGTWSKQSFPYVLALPTEIWKGFWDIPGLPRIGDPFDEKLRARFDAMCAERIPQRAGDPALIGYYLINEPPYEDISKVIPSLKGSQHPCKRRLVEMLRAQYGAIAAFNAAWTMDAKDFDELLDRGLPHTTPAAEADLARYTETFLDAYFQWMSAAFRKYDKNHLLLGNRLTPRTIQNEALCRVMGRYVDVVSFNYYTDRLDTDLLGRVYEWTGRRPMILSEFHWTSPSDSGLPAGVRELENQEARGLAYRAYVEHAASLPYTVGIEWFTLVDQPVSGAWWGRYDGENGNTGLFSVADRPWKKAVEPMAQTNFTIYDVLLGRQPPFAFDHPRFRR